MPSSTEPMLGIAMPHKYKRRTLFEAEEIAWERFSKEVTTHLSADEIADYLGKAILTGGSIGTGWGAILGVEPEPRMHYEFTLCEPAKYEGGPSPKLWARILVTRDRDKNDCYIMWKPDDDGGLGHLTPT